MDDSSTVQERRSTMITETDFHRMERKIDSVSEALNKLVLVEERQSNQNLIIQGQQIEIATLKTLIAAQEKKLDMWINRGTGFWAVVVTLWAVTQFVASRGFFK